MGVPKLDLEKIRENLAKASPELREAIKKITSSVSEETGTLSTPSIHECRWCEKKLKSFKSSPFKSSRP